MTEPRVALVTGSARGMGRAMARCSRRPATGSSASDRWTRSAARSARTVARGPARSDRPGPGRRGHPRDRGSPGRARPQRRGLSIHQPLPEVTLEDFDLQTSVNLRAVSSCRRRPPRRCAPTAWGGSSRSPASARGPAGCPTRPIYASTKAGVISLMKNFARNYGRHGITANAVAPGAVEGFMTQHITPQTARRSPGSSRWAASPTRSRSPTVVDFLASDRASLRQRRHHRRQRRLGHAVSDERKLRLGVIGAGAWAIVAHIPGFLRRARGRAADRLPPGPGAARGDPSPLRVRPRDDRLARGHRRCGRTSWR